MTEFTTQQAMKEIREELSKTQPRLSDLHFTTFYYRKLIRLLKEQKELVLFGAGKYGAVVLAALKREGIDSVRCLCDNNGKVIGQLIDGLEVISPLDAQKQYPGACFVITPKDYDNEILRQLVHMKVSIDNIVIFNIKNTGLVVEN